MITQTTTTPDQRTAISALLRVAETAAGQVQSLYIAGGLLLQVRVDALFTFAKISRAGSQPSQAEWETVLQNWPYPVQAQPVSYALEGRCYLASKWPTQYRMKI